MAFIHVFPGDRTLPIVFNVTHSVGKGCPNDPDDVTIVSFLLKEFFTSSKAPTGLALEAYNKIGVIAKRIVVGTYNNDLQEVINGIQYFYSYFAPNGREEVEIDGRISRAINNGYGAYAIIQMNNVVARNHKDVWPRIDKIPGAAGKAIDLSKKLLSPA